MLARFLLLENHLIRCFQAEIFDPSRPELLAKPLNLGYNQRTQGA
jgi:hypothetical protein